LSHYVSMMTRFISSAVKVQIIFERDGHWIPGGIGGVVDGLFVDRLFGVQSIIEIWEKEKKVIVYPDSLKILTFISK